MIQDDPINNTKQTQPADAKTGYFPLNLDSEEEIVLNGISFTPEKEEEVVKQEENHSTNTYYFQYAMLIGLCKRLALMN